MKINFVSIKNFMGIVDLPRLEFGNFNTFVGKNDSGKSTILKGLDCFFNEKKFTEKDFHKGMGSDETASIEVCFKLTLEIDDLALDDQGYLVIKKEFSLVKGKVKVKTYYYCNDYNDVEHQDLWSKKEAELNEIVAKLGETPKKSGRGNKNLLRIEQIKGLITSTRSNMYHESEELLSYIEAAYKILLPEYSLFDAEQDLDINATNFQSQFKSLISNIFESNKTTTDALEQSLETGLESEFEEIRKFMSKNVSGLNHLKPSIHSDWKKAVGFDLNLNFGEAYDVPISHKGTGFKRLLMVAYFEYLNDKKSVANQIFAIEEPETYLHPSAQEDLLNSILDISKQSQFIISTHSPVFAAAADGDYSVLVTKDASGISHYNRGGAIINQIIKELGIRPDYNLLKNAKFIIFVEGPSDVYFIRHAAQSLLSKDLEADNVLCVPGGGSSLSNYVDLDLFKQLTAGRNDKYAVLVDGDNNDPIKQKEKDTIKAHCDTDGAIFLQHSKRDIENFCHADAIKRTYCQQILDREGAGSRNPRLGQIQGQTLVITPEMDMEIYLQSEGFMGIKSMSKEIFAQMSSIEWQAMDDSNEISQFITDIYSRT